MNEEPTRERMTRRVFLKAGGVTAAAIGGGALLASVPLGGGTPAGQERQSCRGTCAESQRLATRKH
jgi:hypothetical protein